AAISARGFPSTAWWRSRRLGPRSDTTLTTHTSGVRGSGEARVLSGRRSTAHGSRAQFSPGSLIATASTGTAIRFLNSPEYAFPTGEVDGDIATGGGAVSGTSARGFYGLEGIVDTSGRNPEVADCA